MKEKKSKNPKLNQISKSRIVRAFWFVIGIISFGLGTVGIFLPVLPTVPLYLLTSFAFVKSSERFAKWFLNSVFYKKYCENFAQNHAMVIYNELILLLSVSTMLLCVIYFTNSLAVSIILPIVMACKYFYFIFYVKSISKKEYKEMKAELALKQAKEKALKAEQENKEEIVNETIKETVLNKEKTSNSKEEK